MPAIKNTKNGKEVEAVAVTCTLYHERVPVLEFELSDTGVRDRFRLVDFAIPASDRFNAAIDSVAQPFLKIADKGKLPEFFRNYYIAKADTASMDPVEKQAVLFLVVMATKNFKGLKRVDTSSQHATSVYFDERGPKVTTRYRCKQSREPAILEFSFTFNGQQFSLDMVRVLKEETTTRSSH